MNPRWMCDRISTWLKDAAVENGPISLGARALATRMRDLGTGLYPAGYKLVRRAPHARKGSPWIGTKLKQNEERQRIFGDLFDDVTDLGAPSSPALLAHRFAAAGLDRAPKSVTRRLSRSLNATEIPLTAAPSYKSRCGAVTVG
jgi:hypothetical protein